MKCKVTMEFVNGRSKNYIISNASSNDVIMSLKTLPVNEKFVTFPSDNRDGIIFVNRNLITSISIIEKCDYEDF